MKVVRIIGILLLSLGLLVGSVGEAFAKEGPPDTPPGQVNKTQEKANQAGKKSSFSGEVTGVGDGNITLVDKKQGEVVIILSETAKYKVPGQIKGWGNLTDLTEALGGNLTALEGRKVAASVVNVSEALVGEAVRLTVFPVKGQPLHAHRTGTVTLFEPGDGGNITIEDVHGVSHNFSLTSETQYKPEEIGPDDIVVGESFVTVVTKGNPKVNIEAKAVVLHRHRQQEGQPTATPEPTIGGNETEPTATPEPTIGGNETEPTTTPEPTPDDSGNTTNGGANETQ